MKSIVSYITEKQNFLINKKLNTSYNKYEYYPKTKEELQNIIKELFKKDIADLNCIDTSNITDMSYLFDDVKKDFDITYWNVFNVKDMTRMFHNCINFNGSVIENWDVSNVENMNGIFDGCHELSCDLSKWNVSNVKSMVSMFSACYIFDCDLSDWDVSNVENTNGMFFLCKNFIGGGLEKWDVSNIKNMSYMFSNCKKLDCNLEKWNINNDCYMNNMFVCCNKMSKKIPSWYKA